MRFEPWPFWRRWLGQRSERYAARWLRQRGYHILAANWSTAAGELDLLTLDPDGQTIVVVEVRSSSVSEPQPAADSVNLSKQRKLTVATRQFLQTRSLNTHCVRFDVLALSWRPGQSAPQIMHLPNAFEAVDL